TMTVTHWLRARLVRKSAKPARRPRRFLADLTRLEDRTVPTTFRTIDGTLNNSTHTDWGSAGVDFIRKAPAAYGDGLNTPAGSSRPSARVISNTVAAHPAGDLENNRDLSAFVYAWGQFIDHDIDLTNTASPDQAFNIAVPTGDAYFDPTSTG